MLRKNGSELLLILALVLCVPSSAFSEGYYIETGLGTMSMSRDITEFNGAGRAEGMSASRFSSDSSLAEMEPGGYFFRSASAGYFFERLPWLGFEVNYVINNHDIDAAISAKIAKNSNGLRGDLNPDDLKGVVDVSHYSTVGVILKFRPPKGDTYNGFGVFGGLGLGVDILNVNGVEFLDANRVKQRDAGGEMMMDLDLLLSVGIDYKIRTNAKAYGEYKYKNAGFGSSAFDGGVDYEFDFEESSFTFGLAYSF